MANDDFETRLRAAARAAWWVFVISLILTIVGWLGYLALGAGWLDGLIKLGLYGPVSHGKLVYVTLWYVGLFKIIVLCLFLGALFLTLWARLLRRGKRNVSTFRDASHLPGPARLLAARG